MIDLQKVSALSGILRKPHVKAGCIGCSACVAITSAEIFDLDQDGYSRVKTLGEYESRAVEIDDSISACPVSVISWKETLPDGTYANGIVEHQDIS